MAEQYWIGGFYIDLSRNQISQNQQAQTLAPKALAVLTHLAENQGKVVSQEALLDKVWQGTVVSPNTLQRSIAQLRKALGDDGKVQVYIKTHAKQGYSLECDVRWQDHIQSNTLQKLNVNENTAEEESIQPDSSSSSVAKPKNKQLALSAAVALIVSLAFVSYWLLVSPKSTNLSFGELRTLTATDHKEFAGIYSPDGRYVVFNRYTDMLCQNTLWAKDTETQQEFQLNQHRGSYGYHSFSKDGSKLVMIQSHDCSQPITQKKCYKLLSIDFNAALTSPQPYTELMECKNSAIRNPIWLNNGNIALLQRSSDRWRLISYSLESNTSEVLHEVPDGNIFYYDYSSKDDLIALSSVHADDDNYIETLTSSGELKSSHKITFPEEIAEYRLVRPNFSPFDDLMLFSTGLQLFTLSFDGKVSNISLPIDAPMGTPIFHPDGKRMLVIKGHYDADIISMPLAENPEQAGENHTVLHRSTTGEYNAILQPGGDLMAFQSKRSGSEQVWLSSGQSTKQLTRFPMDTYLMGMDWAQDGQSVLVNVTRHLTQVFLDGRIQSYPLHQAVERLFQWDSENNTALALVRIGGVAKFAEINLVNSEITIISESPVQWARKTEQGQLIYLDLLDRYWQSGAIEHELIEDLTGQGSDKGFLLKDGHIWGVNQNFKLWSYRLSDGKFEIISELPGNLDQITDINQETLLGVLRVSAKKGLTEVILK